MKVIGLTGGTGSGKSAVSAFLAEQDFFIIDADKIAHKVIQKGYPAYEELLAHFGPVILAPNGEIDRKALGGIVFADRAEREFLNTCTHKYILLEIKKQIQQKKVYPGKYRAVVLDAPLLIEAGLCPLCDRVWVVYAQEKLRIERIQKRDSLTYAQAENRICAQLSLDEYKKAADAVIENEGSLEDVKKRVLELAEKEIGNDIRS